MRLHISFVIVLCLTTIAAVHAQKYRAPSVNIGDPAPPMRVYSWIKGTPVNIFEKGNIYVVDLWATWCQPCIAEMPRLSALARKYRGHVTVLGVDVLERKTTTLRKIKTFVDSMGAQMDYNVIMADSGQIEKDWLSATEEMGIPTTFIVDREGRLGWMGHPCDNFEDALSKIVNGSWDINKALAKRNLEFRLRNLEDSLKEQLEFAPNGNYRNDSWKRDSALLLVDEVAKAEPLVKYTPMVASQIFSTLLKTNTKKAYEYGKEVLETTTYEKPAGFIISGAIERLSSEINFPPEIYQLGLDAIQVELDEVLSCYPEIRKVYKHYYKRAKWYGVLGNKSKAVEALEKAIEIMKSQNDYLETDLALCEAWLKQYKKM
ncbi:TlpA family protein disulfide reductase [Terrimonas pollutisoli]|uniref:TlpA family protein disulfide reductase n=1 Tax=Terrimonas pollutisoli TaxID=3034147 RepID=UPI0023ECEB72|nr:TlpA disulfide reductase family protein [Terrimonas sp. H1YJ31]